MLHSYYGLIIGKGLLMEDEVGIGLALNKIYDTNIYPYIIAMISLVISLICLDITMRLFASKLPEVYKSRAHFISICFVAGAAAFIAANYLDKVIRINWVRQGIGA